MNNTEILKQIIESRKSTYPKDYTGEEISQILDEILSSAQFAAQSQENKTLEIPVVFRRRRKTTTGKRNSANLEKETPRTLVLEKNILILLIKLPKQTPLLPFL